MLMLLQVPQDPQVRRVGDRPFTDIVYGNRNDFLTILTKPLSLAEEPFIVRPVCFLFTISSNSILKFGNVTFGVPLESSIDSNNVAMNCLQVRRIELALVNRWLRKGLKPANQRLASDPSDCVKELPPHPCKECSSKRRTGIILCSYICGTSL